jgi:multiple sugar transport system substrate-binding protein
MGRLTFALALVCVLMAGCGGSGDGGGDRTQVVLQAFASPDEQKAYETLIAAFEKQNPHIDVKLVPVGDQGDHVAKLTTDLAAGRPADVFLLNYRRFGQFAGKKQIDPAGPRLRASQVLDEKQFYEPALDAFRFGGELQCAPQNISSPVVYYNTALFEQAGIPKPKAGWTWDDMRDAALELTKGDVDGLTFEPSINRFAPFIWQAGGEVVDDLEKPTKVSLFEEPDVEAVTFLVNLRHRDGVVPEMIEAAANMASGSSAAGRAGMLIESRRAVTGLREAEDIEWDVAPLPVHPKLRKPAVMLHSDAYCLAKSSKVSEEAWRFVEFAVGPEGAPILARTGRTVPSLKSVAASDAFLDASSPPASAQVFLDQIKSLRRFPNIAAWNEIEAKADIVVEEWFFGSEPPEALGFEIDLSTLELFAEQGG